MKIQNQIGEESLGKGEAGIGCSSHFSVSPYRFPTNAFLRRFSLSHTFRPVVASVCNRALASCQNLTKQSLLRFTDKICLIMNSQFCEQKNSCRTFSLCSPSSKKSVLLFLIHLHLFAIKTEIQRRRSLTTNACCPIFEILILHFINFSGL